jgi:hypothetical protein
MFVMRTTENPAHPFGKLICSEQSIGLDHLSFSMNPFGLYGVKPRTFLGKQATDDPHATTALSLTFRL